MTTTMQNFKWFLSCIDTTQLKSKFKELAKLHHPDKGGKVVTFQEILAEYNRISEDAYITFPISNPKSSSGLTMDDMDGIFAKMHKQYTQYTQPRKPRTEAEQWEDAKALDGNYYIIDDLIELSMKELRTGFWFLAELFKIDDLTLKHFKYCRYALKLKTPSGKALTEYWVSSSYQNYIAFKTISWELQ